MDIQDLIKSPVVTQNKTYAQQKPVSGKPGKEIGVPSRGVVDEERPWLAEPNLKAIKSMGEYLSFKKMEANIALELAKVAYTSFKNEIYNSRPELAAKDFSFSLDATGNIRIIDTHGTLSNEEKTWLIERIDHRGLKDHLTDHLKTSELLAKYEKTGFSAGYKLENMDLARIIDYGKLLESDDMEQTWKNQISVRAEKRTPFISVRI
ncbi:hypothetical protein EC919_103426 [Pseudomonas graminis]|uniref:hypothetical protein n=1 Tax=Pseudomonas graminis TaxID=158627 RepID=UPI00105C0E7E|nr:hypothetical protein [Pseudomonas graminis]TDV55879.1 hypothetical protein EC919_103426 [Pseudomonas graminis]